MQSIRSRLIFGTTIAVTLILTACGFLIYSALHAFLLRDFDASLTAKAKALASMVELHDHGEISMDYDPMQLPEFAARPHADYFQAWRANGKVLERSASLAKQDLIKLEPTDEPAKHNVILADGRPGRQITIQFLPIADEKEDRAKLVGMPPLQMAVAQSTDHLNYTLRQMLWLLLAVCSGATVASVLVLTGIVRHGVKPLGALAKRIDELGDPTSNQRIDLPGAPSELTPVVSHLNGMLDRLHEAFQREKTITADISHELRTPLAAMEMALELAASRPREDAEYLRTITRCLATARQMHVLVDNLLSLARAEAGQLKLCTETVTIRSFLEECWSLFATRATERGLTVDWQIEHDGTIETDREKLRLVLQNLFDNAVSYANQGGTIQISAKHNATNQLELVVANTGNNLPPDRMERVFDRFWRHDESRTQTGLHCGLGLTLSRRMIELMHGSIRVGDEDGWFHATIHLPVPNAAQSNGSNTAFRSGVLVGLLAVMFFGGCSAAPKPDVAAEASALSGIREAIVFRDGTESSVNSDVPTQLSSIEAVRRTLHYDPRIQSALAKVRMAEADAEQARLLPNPILNIDVRFPESGGSSVFEATLTGDLIAILQKPRVIKAADKRLLAAAADALTMVMDVIAETQETYSAAQAADAQLENIEQRARMMQQMQDLSQRRFQAGEASQLDVMTLDAQRILIAVELSDLRLARAEQRLILTRLIGDPRGAAEWQLDPWQPLQTVHSSEGAWIDAALDRRAEIRSRRYELSALGDDLATANWAAFQGGEVGAHAERDQTWAVGPTVTTPLPIFDFGQAARAKAKAAQIAARHELLLERDAVIEQVRRAYASYHASSTALAQARSELLPSLQKQRERAELAYRNGEADLPTLLLAETGLQETYSKVIDLKQKAAAAMVHLQRAVGGAAVGAEVESATTQPATSPAESSQIGGSPK